MIIGRAAIAAAAIAAPLAFAAPAMAAPGDMNFNCAPCAPGSDTPVWNEIFSAGPWEPFFDSTNGQLGDKNALGQPKGAWESGVEAVNGGSWEKAFPPAE